MSKNNISELDVVAANNADLAGISILGTGLLSTADDSFRTAASFLAKWWEDLGGVNTVGGTGDAISVTTATIYTALKTGMRLQFIASAANTTAATLNLDAIGAKALRKISGGTDVALVSGDIPGAKFRVDVGYDEAANSAAGAWILLGSAPIAAATTSTSGTVGLTQLGIAYNVDIAASVGSSALTVSLKGADGNDPSSTNPVVIPFRNSTLATGTPVLRTVTAATSVVVASTKTMGSSSGVAFRLWVVAVDTGSGIELGLVNCLSTTSIMALLSSELYSPTATPGNSAQVIYTTSGQTAKPICVLGYLDFSSGEATAGTWATAPDRIQVRNLGTKLPGDLVQVQRNDTGTVATGTTVLPYDNTIPQNTEGDQYMSQAITPRAAANVLRITSHGMVSHTVATEFMGYALFQDSTANALAASANTVPVTSAIIEMTVGKSLLATGTSSTTFKIRAGGQGAGTTTFNGTGGTQAFGGVLNSYLQVEELMG